MKSGSFNLLEPSGSVKLYTGIIIITIWHYSPFVAFRLLSQFSPSSSVLSCFLQFLFFIFSSSKSSMTSSCHRCLGLSTGLVPIGFQSNSFLVGLAWSILCIWPSHLILCALINPTISASSINLSISKLFRILHILSILTGPNIFLRICLAKIRRFFPSFAVKLQVSDEYVTTGFIIFYHHHHHHRRHHHHGPEGSGVFLVP